MADIKICKNCKHYSKFLLDPMPRCLASTTREEINIINGDIIPSYTYSCETERETSCGYGAVKFEPRTRAWYAFWKAA